MPDASHSRRLRRTIELVSPRLADAAARLWSHPEFQDLYPAYLCANHAVVRSTVPLLKAALDSALARAHHDPVCNHLAAYLTHHIPEEAHHDDWLLDDLEALGFERRAALERMPGSAPARLVGPQYYWIFHYHPAAILGYIAVLEGDLPDIDFLERTAARAGLPLQAFSTLTRHARLDPQHCRDFDEAVDRMPLTPEHASLMGVSAIHTVGALTRVIEDVLAPDRTGPFTEELSPSFKPLAAVYY